MFDADASRKWCDRLDTSFLAVINERGLGEQPDARAFGAHVEQAVKDEWIRLCAEWGADPRPTPVRRTIYDASFNVGPESVGVDFKSKDLADGRYSDGGVCSVGNLLRFYGTGANFLSNRVRVRSERRHRGVRIRTHGAVPHPSRRDLSD